MNRNAGDTNQRIATSRVDTERQIQTGERASASVQWSFDRPLARPRRQAGEFPVRSVGTSHGELDFGILGHWLGHREPETVVSIATQHAVSSEAKGASACVDL